MRILIYQFTNLPIHEKNKRMEQIANKVSHILIGQLFPNPPLEDGRVYVALLGILPK